jgi:hypothetical protein
MATVDLKKKLKDIYFPSAKEVAVVDVPEMSYLMADGKGDPKTSKDYQDAIEALYSLAYTIKFALKKQGKGGDYVVMPLESLWWTHEEGGRFDADHRDEWKWRAMILQPDAVTAEHLEQARATVKARRTKKKEPVPAALPNVRLERFNEGKSVQILHIGPYSAEPPTIERMHAYAQAQGFKLRGKHHEIYLSDPRRTPEEKWKTVLRHPVE